MKKHVPAASPFNLLLIAVAVLVAGRALAQLPSLTQRQLSLSISASAPAGGGVVLSDSNAPVPAGTTFYADGTSLSLKAVPLAGSIFHGWSGDCSGTGNCNLTMNGGKNVKASFRLPMLSVKKSGSGTGVVTASTAGVSVINCGSDCSESLLNGSAVALAAEPLTGFLETSSCSDTVTLAGDKICNYKFTRPKLSISKTGSGAATATVTGGGEYDLGASAAVTITPGSGHVVRSRTGCSIPCTMNGNKTMTIDIGPPTISVTNAGSGSGDVTSNPAGIACPSTCFQEFASGYTVGLSAVPKAGSKFMGWSGDCTGAGPCSVVNSSKPVATVTAKFDRIYVLNVVKQGSGTVTGAVGTATVINCGTDCSEETTNGKATVSLVAQAAAGNQFKGWTGACSNQGANCTFPLNNTDHSITATFGK